MEKYIDSVLLALREDSDIIVGERIDNVTGFFFIDAPPKIAEEAADDLRNRYLIKVLGEKELLIYANFNMKVVFFENKMRIKQGQEKESSITFCFFASPTDIASRIVSFIESGE